MTKKKKIISLLVSIVISGIGSFVFIYGPHFYAFIKVEKLYNYHFDDSEIPKFDSVEKYSEFVSKTIKYKDEKPDYWQLPDETWKLKTGDCEDYCILFMYLVETRLNKKTSLVLVKRKSDNAPHVVAKIDNRYYEIINDFKSTNMLSSWYVVWEASYEEVMWMTNKYHDNVGGYR